jgi:hypothetical protein
VTFITIKARLSRSILKASRKQAANRQVRIAMQAQWFCRTRKQQGKASAKASNHYRNPTSGIPPGLHRFGGQAKQVQKLAMQPRIEASKS